MSDAFDSIIKGIDEVKAHRDGKINLKQHTLRIAPVPKFTSNKVRFIRNKLKLTQSSFVAIFGVLNKTVEAWESGHNSPNGTAQRLPGILNKDEDF